MDVDNSGIGLLSRRTSNESRRSFVRSFVRCTFVGGGGKELPSFLVASIAIGLLSQEIHQFVPLFIDCRAPSSIPARAARRASSTTGRSSSSTGRGGESGTSTSRSTTSGNTSERKSPSTLLGWVRHSSIVSFFGPVSQRHIERMLTGPGSGHDNFIVHCSSESLQFGCVVARKGKWRLARVHHSSLLYIVSPTIALSSLSIISNFCPQSASLRGCQAQNFVHEEHKSKP